MGATLPLIALAVVLVLLLVELINFVRLLEASHSPPVTGSTSGLGRDRFNELEEAVLDRRSLPLCSLDDEDGAGRDEGATAVRTDRLPVVAPSELRDLALPLTADGAALEVAGALVGLPLCDEPLVVR